MTIEEIIANYKKEYPTLTKFIDGEDLELSNNEYEETLTRWANNAIEADRISAEKAAAKAAILERLNLTEAEAQLLLS